jgi:pyridinium-3,5-bisthiocarboxylic acid mononucleotide nickel chelatase
LERGHGLFQVVRLVLREALLTATPSQGLIRIFSDVINAMRIILLECRSEFTGEALVGALVDLGVSPSAFEWELGGFELGDHHLHFDREEIGDIRGVQFGVHGGILHVDHDHSSEHHHNHPQTELVTYTKLRTQIEAARVSDFVKSHSLGILHRIASAEAGLAGTPLDQIEFPESETLEWLVTAVLSCIGLDQLQVGQIYFQQTGQVQSAERQPTQVALSRAVLSAASVNDQIAARPLGAAILAEFGAVLAAPPELKSVNTGYGLGPETDRGKASFVRATLGEVE